VVRWVLHPDPFPEEEAAPGAHRGRASGPVVDGRTLTGFSGRWLISERA
jgi:hypothetical protein